MVLHVSALTSFVVLYHIYYLSISACVSCYILCGTVSCLVLASLHVSAPSVRSPRPWTPHVLFLWSKTEMVLMFAAVHYTIQYMGMIQSVCKVYMVNRHSASSCTIHNNLIYVCTLQVWLYVMVVYPRLHCITISICIRPCIAIICTLYHVLSYILSMYTSYIKSYPTCITIIQHGTRNTDHTRNIQSLSVTRSQYYNYTHVRLTFAWPSKTITHNTYT